MIELEIVGFKKYFKTKVINRTTQHQLVKTTKKALNGGLNVLYQVIKDNPNIKVKEISKILSRPVDTIDKQIKKLVERKLIERKGSKKTGGYFLT